MASAPSSKVLRLALAQINPTIGALDLNAERILAFARQAHAQKADMVVFPELALTGYPPKDLLLQRTFIDACVRTARTLARRLPAGLHVCFGVPLPLDPREGSPDPSIANSLVVYRSGKLVAFYDKRLLPTYDVFDENRYFTPGDRAMVLGIKGVRIGLSICEDLWRGMDAGSAHRYLDAPDPVADLVSKRAQIIVNPSASPFVLGKNALHRDILAHHAMTHNVFVAAVNQVGGNDDLLFDGHACVIDPRGELAAASPGFVEHLLVHDIDPAMCKAAARAASRTTSRPAARRSARPMPEVLAMPTMIDDPALSRDPCALLFDALVLGVRDYLHKTGFRSAVLGLSGGIDSAVVAVIAAAALGPMNVLGVSLPSRYSSKGSKDDARTLARTLGIGYRTIAIEPAFKSLLRAVAPAFDGRPNDVTEENLQSRARGTILMALSNKLGHLLLTTGNKSELAVGYCTLYGDMNGGLAVISDVAKTLVYDLARWINANPQRLGIPDLRTPPIPEPSITKPPSAELRPNQTDQDSLPPYDVLDELIEQYVEQRRSPDQVRQHLREQGLKIDDAMLAKMIRLIDLSEYKRKQAATGIKVTSVAFGSGRRMPIAQGWRPERGGALGRAISKSPKDR